MTLTLAFLIGFLSGLRSFTPAAVVAWAANLSWLNLTPPLAWMGSRPAVAILTLLALGELVADKLPKTPNRTGPMGLIARIITGGLTGACLGMAGAGMTAAGAVLGAVGGVAGAFGGFTARAGLVKALGSRDFPVAILEDLIAIGLSCFFVSRF